MAIEMLRVVQSHYEGPYPHWVAEVSYGDRTIRIPLPARHVPRDTEAEDLMEAVDGMERLAHALLEFATDLRNRRL